MSDTPRTDAQKRGDFVHINFARELERENAALREALRQIKKKADPTSWTHPVQKADAAYWIAEDTLKRKEAQP